MSGMQDSTGMTGPFADHDAAHFVAWTADEAETSRRDVSSRRRSNDGIMSATVT
jgi:hypothetical protein